MKYTISLLILGIFVFLVPSQTHAQLDPVKLHDLRGMVDAEGTTHLFYRFKKLEIPSEEFPQEDENHIYHLNTETDTDTLFLRDEQEAVVAGPDLYGQESRRVSDFVFPEGDLSSYVLAGHFCVTDCSGYVVASDSGSISEWLGSAGELTLSPGRDTLYSYQDGYPRGTRIYQNRDRRWKKVTEEADSIDLKYRLLSFHLDLDSLAFGTYQNQLIRIGGEGQYEVVKDSVRWADNLDFHYGRDSAVVYYRTINRYYDNGKWTIASTRLYRSRKYGDKGSWNLVAEDSAFFAVETDRGQGRLFMSNGNRLLVSTDQGESFTEGSSFQHRITGIYKPDDAAGPLYVSTTTDIWRVQDGVKVESLKHVQVGMEEKVASRPSRYTLKQNYPNPFNPTTNIEYRLPKATDVRLTVYNSVGRKVATLVNSKKRSGRHRVSFDASRLSSGVYMYRLETEQFAKSRKMLLIK